MNRPESPSRLIPIPDVQAERDERRIAIERVGIKGLRYPLPFADGGAAVQSTIATCNVYVSLPEAQKGTHMSRLVELLEARALPGADPLTVAGLRAFVDALVARLDVPGSRIEIAFPYFVRKTAPVSGVASLVDFDVRLTAELAEGRYTSTIGIAAPVTSLFPCPKEISEYGAHNQRSRVRQSALRRGSRARRRVAAWRRRSFRRLYRRSRELRVHPQPLGVRAHC